MIKKFSILVIMLMFTAAAFSNGSIAGKHADTLKKDNKSKCDYCHKSDKPVEKKKGQLSQDKKKLNGVSISKIANCNGSGCHK